MRTRATVERPVTLPSRLGILGWMATRSTVHAEAEKAVFNAFRAAHPSFEARRREGWQGAVGARVSGEAQRADAPGGPETVEPEEAPPVNRATRDTRELGPLLSFTPAYNILCHR